MAMNTWSADYRVCEEFTQDALSTCVINLSEEGYVPLGGISKEKGWYHQAMYKK